jgi:hypothetical protein
MNMTQTPANSIKGKPLNQTAGRERKGKKIFNSIRQGANNLTEDEIDTLEPSISPKRNRQENPLSKLAARANERRKRINSSSDQRSSSVDPLPGAVD